MPISYKVIGGNIRKARQQAQLTQEGLAEKMSISIAHMGKIERGERQINLERLSQICELLGVSLEAMVEGALLSEGTLRREPLTDRTGFIAALDELARGCSDKSLRLMLRLCQDVSQEDKA